MFKLYFNSLYVRFKGRPAALKKAIHRANKLCRVNKKRYRVYFLSRKYQAISRPEIQWRKKTGGWKRHVNVTKMEPMCFYDTLLGLQPEGAKLLKTRNFKF